MPPWPEWQVEYVGSSFLGKLLGLWSASWVRLLTAVFRSFGTDAETRGQHNSNRARLSIFEVGAKLFRLAISTVLMLGFWRVATLKPFWSAFNESGHRIIVGLLCLLTALWMISVVWICFSKPHRAG